MNVLILSPHPDDSAIGMGGTIIKLIKEGHNITVIYMTSGELGGDPTEREQEALVSDKILGVTESIFWRYHDSFLATDMTKARDRLAEFIDVNKIDQLYSTMIYDTHPDHRATYEIALFQNVAHHHTYEVWMPIQIPHLYVDISAYAALKRVAIRAHKSQLVNAFDEAILSLNHYRAILHGKNEMYIEAFS